MATKKKSKKKEATKITALQTTEEMIKHVKSLCSDFILSISVLEGLSGIDPESEKVVKEFYKNFGTMFAKESKEYSDAFQMLLNSMA
jgi:hypothetical protein